MKTVLYLVYCANLMLLSGACTNVLHLPFNDVYDDLVSDSSINSNDGITHGCVQVNLGRLANREMGCAPYVRMNSGYITLNGNHFRGKPMHGVTMAVWVKLSSVGGEHSIFCTIGGNNSTHTWGQYHFEVNNGKVRWFHRNERRTTVFSVETNAIVQANNWTHIAGTYDSGTGAACVYVNGKMVKHTQGSGTLSQDWETFAGIGRQGTSSSEPRTLGGYLDEFNMYDRALKPQEVARLYSICKT